MTKFTLFILAAIIATLIAACGGAATKAPATTANTVTNTTPPVALAPTLDALFAMDKEANEALIKGDAAFFESFLSDKFVSYDKGQRMGKAEILKMMSTMKCDVKAWKLEDPRMSRIDDDAYVVSYKGTFDGTCTGPDGKAMKLPSPTRAVSIYVREGGRWRAAFHGENLIFDPATPPAAVPALDKKA